MVASENCLDLWVSGRAVPHLTFREASRLRCSTPEPARLTQYAAMSADILRTLNAKAGFALTHNPGSNLRFPL